MNEAVDFELGRRTSDSEGQLLFIAQSFLDFRTMNSVKTKHRKHSFEYERCSAISVILCACVIEIYSFVPYK